MDFQRLAKVLAMAASDNDTEALHALRTAKRLLEGAGLDFVTVADILALPPVTAPPERNAAMDELEDTIFELRNEIRHLRAENERLRQGRGPATPPAAPPTSFHERAEEANAILRLRAELSALAEQLESERLNVVNARNAEARMAQKLQEAEAGAHQARIRSDELESRKLRTDAEMKRQATLRSSLEAELGELRQTTLRQAAELAAYHVREQLEDSAKKGVARKPRKGKSGVSQMALF